MIKGVPPAEAVKLVKCLGKDIVRGQEPCQIFTVNHEKPDEWINTNLSGILFISCNVAPFFKLVDLKNFEIVWEHEFYYDMNVSMLTPNFLCFEGHHSIIGINFDEDSDVEKFISKILNEIEILKSQNNLKENLISPQKEIAIKEEKPNKQPVEKQSSFGSFFKNTISFFKGSKNKPKGEETNTRKKIVIQGPKNFDRQMHIGFESGKGYQMEAKKGFNAPGFSSVFKSLGITNEDIAEAIGISEEELNDEKNQKILKGALRDYKKMMKSNKVNEEIQDVEPPIINKEGISPPITNDYTDMGSLIKNDTIQHSSGIDVPPPPPPPPPPLPLPGGLGSGKKIKITKKSNNSNSIQPPKPKPDENFEKPHDLLSAIRNFKQDGNKLKPISQAKPSNKINDKNLLIQLINKRRNRIDPDSEDDEDENEDDEDWEN